MTVKEALAEAQSQIGTTEYPSGSNMVKYNTWFYGRAVSGGAYPWCCTFACWLFRNNLNLIQKTASCSSLATWFRQNRQFYASPKVGDLVFFNFHTPGKLADHIGIVEKVNPNGSIGTIEGNTSVTSNDNGGAVMRRTRKASIVGYGRPKYSDSAAVPTTRQTIKEGSKGADVQYLHQRLFSMGFGVDPADDYFDRLTGDCVQYLQITHNLEPDRIVGQKTWNVIENC